MTRSTLPAFLCLAALVLTGCGSSDVLTPPPLPEPTATSSLLNLPEDPEETETPAEEDEVPTSNVALTEADAMKVVTALGSLPAKDNRFWIGRKEGKEAVKTLKVDLDPATRTVVVAVTDEASFVCVEAKDNSAHTLVTVVGDAISTRSGDEPCPEADIALVEALRDHAAEDAARSEKEKERRKKQRAKDKAAEEAAQAEAEAAETAALLAAVQSDAAQIATMLTDMLDSAPKGPKKPGEPADIRDYDTVAEVTKALTASGIALTDDNQIGSVTKTPKGFIVCVEASDTGPSATHDGITGKTVTVEDSGC